MFAGEKTPQASTFLTNGGSIVKRHPSDTEDHAEEAQLNVS